MVKVRVITPLCNMSDQMATDVLAEVAHLTEYGIDCDNVDLGAGPDSIEGYFDETLAAPFVAIEAIKAQNEGIDATIIDCMGDPGLMAAREAVSFPVIGPGEACMHMAGLMGHRFSCVSILDSVRPIFFAHAKMYGVADKLASVRNINVPVLELEELGNEGVVQKLFEESRIAVEQDLADTIILGCTGFVGVADQVHQKLVEAGYNVPVINPLPTAVLLAAMMVWGSMSHSPHAYHKPNFTKQFTGFAIPTPKL